MEVSFGPSGFVEGAMLCPDRQPLFEAEPVELAEAPGFPAPLSGTRGWGASAEPNGSQRTQGRGGGALPSISHL